ncbi:ABC transporter permease [Psittacicella melopsittaci]|uniref:ABC transporter permease n=1 Tax=Psittacicella melopsittaci TaxID=2028576 RepID=A0A3A1Y6U0_9GAMM|nr:ABC transporter permease [Psittacicella melopsittaci]RIY33000.1 ABC transporter permease [Psittacicella melopsittaci]
MKTWFKNVFYLSMKEFRSLFSDPILIALIVYLFSMAVYSIASMPTTEIKNGAVAVVDYDKSSLTYRLRDSLREPSFKKVEEINYKDIDKNMDQGNYTFIIVFPPNFEADYLKQQNPKIQVLVDATSMTLANVGSSYINQIFTSEIRSYFKQQNISLPLDPEINVLYNPNYYSSWYMGTNQISGFMTLLILLLVGAAIIREKERGTIEHLLVMPVNTSEIATAKIISNSLVLLLAATLSLIIMIKLVIGVPYPLTQIPLFILGAAVFLFSVSSLGIVMAVAAPTLPQFALICIPVYVVLNMLSGALSPVENMPTLAYVVSQFFPTTIFNDYMADIIYRHASLSDVWLNLVKLLALGSVFIVIAFRKFKSMLAKQG